MQIIQPPGDCGTGPNHSVNPTSISSEGVVAGTVDLCGGLPRAFRWSATDGFLVIPLPPGSLLSHGNDMSESGIVVGAFDNGLTRRAFSHSQGEFSVLDLILWGSWSEAFGVNSDNTTVGWFFGGGKLRACRWSKGGFLEDLSVGLPLAGTSQAVAINEHGVIAGFMGQTTSLNAQTFVWNNYQVTNLGLPFPDAIGLFPTDIDNLNRVCGYWTRPSLEYPFFERGAFYFDGNEVVDLLTMPDWSNATATGLNNNGSVVGLLRHSLGGTKAVLWANDSVFEIRDMVDAADDWFSSVFFDVNDNGQIIGTAFDASEQRSIGFVLSPMRFRVGDTNCDALVNIDDLVSVITHWGPCKPTLSCPVDLDDDDTVGMKDLVLVLKNWD